MSNIKLVCFDGATEIFKVDSNGTVTSTLDIVTSGVIQSTNTVGTTIFSTTTEISNTTPSTNSSTGALVLEGGLSINATANSASNTEGGALTVRGGTAILGDLYIDGTLYGELAGNYHSLKAGSTAESTSATTGALQVAGGAGFGGNSHFEANVTIDGNLVIPSGTVDGRNISTDGAALDNLVTTIGLSALTSAEVDQLENINSTTISTTQWGYLGALNQALSTGSTVSFGTVNGRTIATDGSTLDNLNTTIGLSALTSAEVDQLENIDTITISNTQWGYLGAADQPIAVGSNPTFGNVIVTGTVDGRDIATDGGNLDNLYTTIGLSALTSAEVDQLENIGSTTISATQWGYLGSTDQALATTDNVTFNSTIIDSTGTEALLVRKDADGGDIFIVDTTNENINVLSTTSLPNTVNSLSAIGGALNISGDTVIDASKQLHFAQGGIATPTFTTRSAGTKVVLFPGIDSSNVDYGFGIASETLWSSIPNNSGSVSFKWYGGTTEIMALTGNGNLTLTGTVDGRDIAADGVTLDALDAGGLSALTAAEIDQLENIDSVTISNTQWGYLGAADQEIAVGSNPTFGNIIVTGTVDGRDVATDGGNLDNLYTTIGLSALTSAEVDQLENIGSTTISATQWGYLGAANQALASTDNVIFNSVIIDSTGAEALLVRKDSDGGDGFVVNTSSENVSVLFTTESTDTSTGALTIAGGLGVIKNLNVGGDTLIAGNLTVSGTQTIVSSESLSISDNLIQVNSGPTSTRDGGLLVQRYQTENDTAAGDLISDTAAFTDTLPDQSSAVSTTVILSGSASAVDDAYNGTFIYVTAGTGINQIRLINDYVGSTKTATINTAWTTQPATSDSISILDRVSVASYYDETGDVFRIGYTASNSSSATIVLSEPTDLAIGGLTMDSNLIVDTTETEALLVRKNSDGGDVFTVDTTNTCIKLGPGGANHSTMLSLYGTVTSISTGPHISATTTVDTYPVFQQLNWDHDNIQLSFDCYYDDTVTLKSSDFGSNYQIYKVGDKLSFTYDSGVSVGSTVSPSIAMSIGIGNVSFSSTVSIENIVTIDGSNTEMFLVRKDGDSGDVFTVDTTNNNVRIDGNLIIDTTDTSPFVIRKNDAGGDLFVVNTVAHTTKIQMTTESISTTTGALQVSGGIGIGGNISVSGTVDGRDIAADGVTLDALDAGGLSALTTAEIDQLENIDSVTISNTQWGYLGGADQAIAIGSNVTFGNIIVTGTVDGRDIAADGVTLDALDAGGLSALTTAEIDQLENIDSVTISNTQWGYLGAADQSIAVGSNPTFGNVIVTGTVDGRDVAADGTALDNLVTTIGLNALTSGEVDQLENIDSVTISNTQWGYLGGADQAIAIGSNVTFGNVIVSGTVDGRDVAADGTALDNLVATIGLSALTSAEVDQLENIGSTTISATQWGYLGAADQPIAVGSNPTFGNVIVTGTVDGRDIAADGVTLDALDAGGLSALTAAEIDQLENINSVTISNTQWGYLGAADQSIAIGSNVTFGSVVIIDTVESTGVGNGALIVDGGVGIDKTIQIGNGVYVRGNGKSLTETYEIVLGAAPNNSNNDYCSVIRSTSNIASNFTSTLTFLTHGAATTGADPTLALTLGFDQKAYFESTVTAQGSIISDVNSTEALLIRKDGDSQDVFVVDTTNQRAVLTSGTSTTVVAEKGLSINASNTATFSAGTDITNSNRNLSIHNGDTTLNNFAQIGMRVGDFTNDILCDQILIRDSVSNGKLLFQFTQVNTAGNTTTDFLELDNGSSLMTVNAGVIIDGTSTEAFLIRQDGDSADVFTVDTTNLNVRIDGNLIIDATDYSPFVIRKNSAGGDIFVVDTINEQVTCGSALLIDHTNTEALLVRKDSDGGDIFSVDTTNSKVYVNQVEICVSAGDLNNTSFAGANNQASAVNVTGFLFSESTVRSFKALVSVEIDATADLYEQFELRGLQKATGTWVITDSRLGDDTDVEFTILSTGGNGQIQYTSANYAGFSTMTIHFRAWVN